MAQRYFWDYSADRIYSVRALACSAGGEMTIRELIHGAITQQWTTGLALVVVCALLTLFAAVTGK